MALLVFRQYLAQLSFDWLIVFFLKDVPSQVLQNGVIFINENIFHHFETCTTIYWSNSYNFQKQPNSRTFLCASFMC